MGAMITQTRQKAQEYTLAQLVLAFAAGAAVGFLFSSARSGPVVPVNSKAGSEVVNAKSPNSIVEDAWDKDLPPAAFFRKPVRDGLMKYRNKKHSQIGQDKLVDEILGGMTSGFFIESGAYNGVDLSNTIFFEATRGWKGLLVEANPVAYQQIIDNSNRTADVIHACISPTTKPSVLNFRMAGELGGLVDHMSDYHVNRINKEMNGSTKADRTREDVKVSCWPLASMLKTLGVHRVDYWSLDTEGSEAAILAATDFDVIDIRVLTIEVNGAAAEKAVMDVMSKRSEYKLHSKLAWDLVYVKSDVTV